MEVSSIPDALAVSTSRGLGFAKFLLNRRSSLTYEVYSTPESLPPGGIFAISTGILPVDAVSPPAVRSTSCRAPPRLLARTTRRTRRKSLTGEADDSGDFGGFFGDGDDGPFGGGGGGSGGGGWNFGREGGSNWEEDSPSRDLAFDFVYEVLSWIALSNCIHFAFKKVVRDLAGGIGDASPEKAPVRLVTGC